MAHLFGILVGAEAGVEDPGLGGPAAPVGVEEAPGVREDREAPPAEARLQPGRRRGSPDLRAHTCTRLY